MTGRLINLPTGVEQLLVAVTVLLGLVAFVLVLRAVLGVNRTHEKLDEILRELRGMKRHRSGESDPPDAGNESEDKPGREGK